MAKRTSLGLAAASLMLAAGTFPAIPERAIQRKRYFAPEIVPNDHRTIVDTTPESKRARRRRLAKEQP